LITKVNDLILIVEINIFALSESEALYFTLGTSYYAVPM